MRISPRGTYGGRPVAFFRIVGGAAGVAFVLAAAVAPAAADEQDVTRTVEATVQNIAVEAPEGAADDLLITTVVEVDGQVYDLPDDSLPAMETGDVVELGVQSDADLSVTEAMEAVSTGDVDEANVVTVEPQAATVTDQSVLAAGAVATSMVILPVYWSAAPDETVTTLRAFGQSAADYWREQSGGTVAVQSVDVRDFRRISAPAGCTDADLTSVYNAAVAAHGVAGPSDTRHVVVYFPDFGPCAWAGMASVGGGRIWVNGSTVPDVLAHEFGHNLGVGHANTLTCASGGYSVPLALPASGCAGRPYGDYADVMGVGMVGRSTGSLNTSLADQLGLAQLVDVSGLANGTGTFDIAPLTSVGSQRALRIPTSEGQVYVDYRPAEGRDVRWSGWAGVQVHLLVRDARGVPTSYLLNMRPSAGDFADPSLPVGQAWTVPGTSVSLTVLSTGATARIQVAPSVSVSSAVEGYVTRVYGDLFGRSVDAGGMMTWSAALMSGVPRIAVANSITSSTEYRSQLIAGSYGAFLGRSPDSSGLAFWLTMMATSMTIQQMESGFLASAEYYQRVGSANDLWVRELYRQVLGREAAASEVNHWVSALAAGQSRDGVAMGFLLSTERLTTVVDGYYVDLLGRHIDPNGQAFWVSSIQAGARLEAIIGGIVASDEYFARS